MRIGDAAAAAGTTPRALRFYEANGLLPAPQRTRAGQRVYGPAEVARLRVIRELLSLGLTIADIRACAGRLVLLESDTLPPYGGPGACAGPTGIARRRIAALDAEIARLTALRDQLAARIGAEPLISADPVSQHVGTSSVGTAAASRLTARSALI
jgi:MerR family copper efflux transcriptional regulator